MCRIIAITDLYGVAKEGVSHRLIETNSIGDIRVGERWLVRDLDGNPKFLTSTVENVVYSPFSNNIVVETKNSLYELEIVEE